MISYLWNLSNILYNTLFIRTRMPYKKYSEDTILLAGQAELALIFFIKDLHVLNFLHAFQLGQDQTHYYEREGTRTPGL